MLAEGSGLPAEVIVVEPTGADTQLYCRFNGQELASLIRDRVTCRAGDRIRLKPDLGRAHLFDAASGARLVA
jgi:multiple sugar transport system ATP-binding protein